MASMGEGVNADYPLGHSRTTAAASAASVTRQATASQTGL